MFDLKKIEQEALEYWRDHDIFAKSMETRKKAKRFVFFEGPPTANGLPHIGHFLTRVYKDVYGRYKTMQGFFVLRKAGWDTHGLPVEIEVEKELGFKNKKDIEEYGIGKFNKKARESVWKYTNEWSEMTRKMGFWIDLKNPYITYDNKYVESLWNIIHEIWKKDLLYLAHRVVPFCTRCGTPLSSHEVAQGYKLVKDRSVYIKFKLKKGQKPAGKTVDGDTYILAWTTTPWTLPGNVALAVGKKVDYVLASAYGENFVVARDLAEKVLGPHEIKNSFKGADLVGLEYEPLFDVKELKSENSYKVYDADFVTTSDGAGVVHTAVMYGEDDYNLGTKLGLPKFHTVNEAGKFVGSVKDLAGKYVKSKETEEDILAKLNADGALFKEEEYEHEYPFCWRCNTPLLYYAKESWFIKMSAVNKELLANNDKINWYPEHLKNGRFGQWLKEGKDWAFSRERYWGTPLPIWKCQDCGKFHAIGSLEELEQKRYKKKNIFYILRHGHSEKNGTKEGHPEIISSRLENDKYHLTKDGREQIEKVAGALKKKGGVDIIVASPFLRTKETAEIVGKELGVKVKTDERIWEFQHGSACEGSAKDFCVRNHRANIGWDYRQPDGESWRETRARMFGALKELDEQNEGKTILIVSHGDPIWLLKTAVLGMSPEEAALSRDELFPQQGELAEIDFKNWPYDDEGNLDVHRPYIDAVELKCDCGGRMKKVPELIDVWFDSGAMPFAQWHYPFENKDEFKKQFPADFITEAIDQTRGWFFTLLAISTLLDKGAPYKNVYVVGHTLDEKGQKMSKSKKNFVPVMELMDKYGADVIRWYFLSLMPAGESKSVIPREIEDKIKGYFGTLSNTVRFYELYAGADNSIWNGKVTNLLDKWILSRLDAVIRETTRGLDEYDILPVCKTIEKFVIEDLSNWWLRRSRKRKEAVPLLRHILLETAKIIAPFTPFVAEDIHRRMIKGLNTGVTSVHLHDYPKAAGKVDMKLEEQMAFVREIINAGLAERKNNQLKVRQPLKSVSVRGKEFHSDLEQLIKEELNVKEIEYNPKQEGIAVLNTELSPALISEGWVREAMRQIQDMRKEAGYKVDEKVSCRWSSADQAVVSAINEWAQTIKEDVMLAELINGADDGKVYDVQKELELAPGKSVWLGLKK